MVLVNHKTSIVEYFKKNLLKGYTEESLKIALVNQGYSRMIIERALEQAHKELAKKAPVLKEKPLIKYEILDTQDKIVKVKESFWWKLKKLFVR